MAGFIHNPLLLEALIYYLKNNKTFFDKQRFEALLSDWLKDNFKEIDVTATVVVTRLLVVTRKKKDKPLFSELLTGVQFSLADLLRVVIVKKLFQNHRFAGFSSDDFLAVEPAIIVDISFAKNIKINYQEHLYIFETSPTNTYIAAASWEKDYKKRIKLLRNLFRNLQVFPIITMVGV